MTPNKEMPVLAIELNGKEHYDDEGVKCRDREINEICKKYDFELIRVDNSYARWHNCIKDILVDYFGQ